MSTPAGFEPTITHSPVSPGLVGVFPLIISEPEESGQDSISGPAAACVIGSTVIVTVCEGSLPLKQTADNSNT